MKADYSILLRKKINNKTTFYYTFRTDYFKNCVCLETEIDWFIKMTLQGRQTINAFPILYS